ncbi:MAG: FtsX-like permease family protein [Candidatus Saccharibacteria bacterium]
MFYIKYLFAEIFRRFGKTITIVLGLAIASAIIILILSFSQALSDSQQKVLNPLANVGTDIMLTRSLGNSDLSKMDTATRQEYQSENRLTMDFSKLGIPGATFSTDQFMPGSMLTFDSSVTNMFDKNLVADYAQGLILNINHMEGTIPKVSTTITTGARSFNVDMTDAQRAAFESARAQIEKLGLKPGDPAAQKIMDSVRSTTTVTAPSETITKDVGPIQTDVKTTSYTISGVDITKKYIGLILPSQITSGTYFAGDGDGQIILNKSYASKNNKNVGDEITLASTKYKIVGIVDPKLYTNTTDFYLPLTVLQKVAPKTGRVNIVLIKATSSDNVAAAGKQVSSLITGANIVDSQATAQKVSGSIVQATKLTNKFIGLTSIVVVIASFVIVSLLTIFSINKRVREIGTLKAIGWSNTQVVRQILSENVVLGVLGAIFGIALGVTAIVVLNHYNISLNASVQSLNSAVGGFGGPFGRNSVQTTATVDTAIQLKININYIILLIGGGVAILGSVVAGFFAALKVSRLKPQVALRSLE